MRSRGATDCPPASSPPEGSSARRGCRRRADQAETRLFFRVVPVFDRRQVDALPDREQAPLEPPREPITGDSHAQLLEPLETLAAELGYRVTFVTPPPRMGGATCGLQDDRRRGPARRAGR
jgi:hypothetical protein